MSDQPFERNVEVVLRDGQVLRAWREGLGPPLLLVHGFTGSVEAWGADAGEGSVGPGGSSLLEELARSYDVVAVDLLGHGASDRPTHPERYSLPETLVDLGELLDHCGLGAAHWIGYSMGGRIALAAALETPARVAGLVLESASPGLETEDARADRRAHDLRLAEELEAAGLVKFVDAWMALPVFSSQARLSPAVRENARRRRLRGDARAWSACLRGLGLGSQPSYWNRLSSLRSPTLLLTGSDDSKFSALATRMAAGIPTADHVEIPNVGHQVHLESPEPWLSLVRWFLDSVETL